MSMIKCRYCNQDVGFLGHDCTNNNRSIRWKTRKTRRNKTEQQANPDTRKKKT